MRLIKQFASSCHPGTLHFAEIRVLVTIQAIAEGIGWSDDRNWLESDGIEGEFFGKDTNFSKMQ